MTIFVISGIGFVCCNSSNVVRVAMYFPPQNNQFFSSKITQLLIIIRHGDLLPQVLLVHPQPFKGKHNFLCFRMPYKLSGHTGADKFFLISKMGLHKTTPAIFRLVSNSAVAILQPSLKPRTYNEYWLPFIHASKN